MQRKIQFNFVSDDNVFKLAVTEMIREERHEFDDPALNYLFYRVSRVSDYLVNHIDHFNALDKTSGLSGRDFILDDSFTRKIPDRLHPGNQFTINYFSFKLHMNVNVLLQLLGSLDGGLHTMIYHNKETGVEYLHGAPRHDDLPALCQSAFARHGNLVDTNKEPLSRELAKWLIDNLPDKESDLVRQLRVLLALECKSLTPAIRDFLYPRKTVAMMLVENCQDADDLTKELLNPAVSFVHKDKKLVAFISGILGKITKADADNPVTKQQVYTEISNWFNKFINTYQNAMWRAKIDTIVGLPAFDGGFFTINYTEMQLLLEANIVFNHQGLAELKFLHTRSYRRNYAEGQRLYDILDKELTQICHDLDLHFLPNQNFHHSAVFDEDSSRALRNAGFHYTENYCKEIMRNERLMQMFRFSAQSGGWHDMQILNPHKPLQQMILSWANNFERKEGLWVKAKPKEDKQSIQLRAVLDF